MTDQRKRTRLREILAAPEGIIAPGVTDALFARLAQDCGYGAVHLSGNAIHKNYCLPDRNLLNVTQIAQRVGQISEATDIPLIVDGGSLCVEVTALSRAVKYFERAGVAAIRFEDSLVNEYGAAAEDLVIPSLPRIVDQIKAAVNARRDNDLLVIVRCDSRPKESLLQVQERLAAYADAGADAVGVQLSDKEEFRQVGATANTPLVSMWPRTLMTAFEFLRIGFRIALMPSSTPLAALAAAREMLIELQEKGTEREYFTRQREFPEIERWYKNLGRE
jgi:2-methylisocitrate lyase-like PEP mutase family enzyme